MSYDGLRLLSFLVKKSYYSYNLFYKVKQEYTFLKVYLYSLLLDSLRVIDTLLFSLHFLGKINWLTLFDSSITSEGLIFFAAEDEGKTEEPTEKRKQKEREKGRVPKSAEISSALVTLGVLLVMFILSSWLLDHIFKILKYFLGNFNNLPEISIATLELLILKLTKELTYILAPMLLIGVIMATVGNIAQVGFLFTLKPLQFDISRIKLTPSTIMKKIFFSKQVGFNLIKTIAKTILLAFVSWFIIYTDFLSVLKTGSMGVGNALRTLSFTGFKLALILTTILLIISIPDYFYQKHEFTENIKMTKQEIKEELKETEGDPLTKQRQKKRSLEVFRRGMLTQIKKADIVITNPIHFALALRYDPDKENAPRILAKGEDHLALVIKNLARKDDIPIIENKPLARELYYNVNENEVVPEQFYQTLIDIFLSIESIRERLQAKAS